MVQQVGRDIRAFDVSSETKTIHQSSLWSPYVKLKFNPRNISMLSYKNNINTESRMTNEILYSKH